MTTAICFMAMVNPADTTALTYMAAGAVLLGFSSATQDIVIDAYRIEIVKDNTALQSVTAAMYVAGYRVGMIVAGTGALWLAAKFGSHTNAYVYAAWQKTYLVMAAVMGIGVATTLVIHEPSAVNGEGKVRSVTDNFRLLLLFLTSVAVFVLVFSWAGGILPKGSNPLITFGLEVARLLVSVVAALAVGILIVQSGLVPRSLAVDTWIEPITDFFRRYGKSALLLALIGVYRISDIVAGVIPNVFYKDMGFSKEKIAAAVKTFGVIMMVVGGFVGGLLSQRFSLMKMMMTGSVLAALTNLLFVALAYRGHDVAFMYWTVGLDNLAAGLVSAVFVAFLSALTNNMLYYMQFSVH